LNIGLSKGSKYGRVLAARSADECLELMDAADQASQWARLGCVGSIWATKDFLNHFAEADMKRITHGIREPDQRSSVMIHYMFSSVSNLLSDESDVGRIVSVEMTNLPMTEIIEQSRTTLGLIDLGKHRLIGNLGHGAWEKHFSTEGLNFSLIILYICPCTGSASIEIT
jgi:hypothetical protein